jgi:hypothetical protein
MTRAATAAPVLTALAALVAAAGAGCVNLDNPTTVKDLRVLAVRAEPAGFLVNLADPGGGGLTQADLQSKLTALVVDPKGANQTVTFGALGCPDLIIDAITSATGQGTHICPAPGSEPAPPPQFAALAPELATTPIPADGSTLNADPAKTLDAAGGGIEYQPELPLYGFSPEQLALFFTPQMTGNPVIDQTISYNRDFGMDASVNINFMLGSEQASAVKRIVYWPDLSSTPDLAATFPADLQPERPNANPIIEHIEFYSARDPVTGDPMGLTGMDNTTVGASDKVYVLPVPAPNAAETYPLRVRNTQTQAIETRVTQELLDFAFFTTAGTFSPAERQNTPFILSDPNSPIHLDSQLNLPAAADIPADGKIDIWIVVHDERGGTNWIHGTVNVTP